MSCLTDDVVAAWCDGALDAAHRQAALAHALDCDRCRAFVGYAFAADAADAADAAGPQPPMPTQLGRYRVDGALASGAMGVVLRATDMVLERAVALKLARDGDAPGDRGAQALAEARALARIDHPNVVTVLDSGDLEGEVFVAMALVEGDDVRRWLAAATRSPIARLTICVDVARGLDAIHAAGLVHRDIKPENVLIRPDGRAIIVDLGLARATDAGGAVGSGVAGTRGYLAPELLAGARASAASDQFAWGRLVDEVLADGALAPTSRAAVAAVVARAQHAQPAGRWPSMVAAAEALTTALTIAPVPGRSARGRAMPVALVGATLLAGGAIAAALVAGGAGGAPAAVAPAAEPCEAVPPVEWTPAARAALEAPLRSAGVDPGRVQGWLDARAAVVGDQRAAACVAERGQDAIARARASRQRACLDQAWLDTSGLLPGLLSPDRETVRGALDELIDALPPEACARDVVPALPAPAPPGQHPVADRLGPQIAALTRAEATPLPTRIAALEAMRAEVLAAGHLPLEVFWRDTLARALLSAGRLDDGAAALAEARAAARRAGDDAADASLAIAQLRVDYQRGQRDEAHVRDADAAVTRLGNPATRARLDEALAQLHVGAGEPARAVPLLEQALAAARVRGVTEHGQLIDLERTLGVTLQLLGEHGRAQAHLDAAARDGARRFGEGHPATLELRGVRATGLLYGGDPAAAAVELDALIAGRAALGLGAGDPTTATLHGYRCEAAIDARAPDAMARCRAALEAAEAVFGPADPQLAWTLRLVGQLQVEAGQLAPARATLERALAVADASLDPRDPAVIRAYLALALRRSAPGRARALARAALAELPDDARIAPLRQQLAEL